MPQSPNLRKLKRMLTPRYKLRAKDLATLPHAAVPNPINPSFSLMHLFRRPDVVRAAIGRWGSVPAMWKQVGSLSHSKRVLQKKLWIAWHLRGGCEPSREHREQLRVIVWWS